MSPISGRSAVRLARLLWEQEVPGSNPGAPTIWEDSQEAPSQKSYVTVLSFLMTA